MKKNNAQLPTPSFTSLSFEDRCQNVLLAGFPESGKVTFGLLPLLMQDCKDKATGIVIIATHSKFPKLASQLASGQNRPYLYFDPAADLCPFFNPLAGPEEDAVEAMVRITLDSCPDLPRYFKDIYEQVLRNAIKLLKRLDKAEGVDGKYSTLVWLSHLLSNLGGQGREMVQKFSRMPTAAIEEAKENAGIVSWFLNEYFKEFSKIFESSSGLRGQINALSTHRLLRDTLNPDRVKGEFDEVDFTKCIKNGGIICISTAEDLLDRYSVFLGQALMERLRSTVMRSSDARLSLYICNAAPLFTPSLLPLLEKEGVAVHLSLTASSELAIRLGSHAGKQFIERTISGMQNIAVFPGLSGKDARMYLDHLSTHEPISPSEVSYQPFGSALCRFVCDGLPMPPQFVDLRAQNHLDPTIVSVQDIGHPAYTVEP